MEKLRNHFSQADRDIRDIRISTDKVKRRGEKIDGLQFDDGPESSDVLEPPRPKVVGE